MNSVGAARGQASVRAMEVARGMFALRYVATAVSGVSPRVVVSVDPDNSDDVRMLFSPGATPGVLRQPGDLCVITAERDSTVLITTLGNGGDLPDAVTLQIDRLDRDMSAFAARPAQSMLAGPSGESQAYATPAERVIPLRIAAHVERRGDVFVTGGDWLEGINGAARIEGFSVQWPRRPAKVDISYGCALLGLGRMPDVVVGEFVGTRMQARAINGVSFRLIGEDAEAYALIVEARFSDGTHIGPTPAPVDLRGPTGREHLIGLRLQLSEVASRGQRTSLAAASSAGTRTETAARKPARIFRAPRAAAGF
ncbi:hypothetical protein MKK68_02065 [Methylobacterium sp. E-016]|uniref:hypothetical protein n=1 Tax=Methylobacterium sp. E-016 TaxID=2836556 RepID=UPI001FB9C511|nr:hypothetical protein [Methylobacterium sp. E-016]MCJ2074448.1 hypothetical protein [Methylobacterium sp. E-016]